jgi:hypothetical protein
MGRLPWPRGSGCQKFDLVGALFLFDGGRSREGKKKEKKKKIIDMEKEGFPGAGLALLVVQQVAAVRCN